MTTITGTFYEFFAGGGMARKGLGKGWKCLFANDFDHKKSETYKKNWGDKDLLTADVKTVKSKALPESADLVWGSFPCQDLSLAGGGAGLKGERSGTFWPFWGIVKSLIAENRAPKLIALENVCGTITSHEGKDFSAICSALSKAGYNFGAVVVDAKLFAPQSRPRLFIIGISKTVSLDDRITTFEPTKAFHTKQLIKAQESLSPALKKDWVWLNLSPPKKRAVNLTDLIEENPSSVTWHTKEETKKLLEMMSDLHLRKVKKAQATGVKTVGTIYRRTRKDENGEKVQRAEVRLDGVAGCLRTPRGGSSRQIIIAIEGNKIRTRLISSRETARLMGLPDSYKLPENYNEAYHLTGDGVAVPVVSFLTKAILTPVMEIINGTEKQGKRAA